LDLLESADAGEFGHARSLLGSEPMSAISVDSRTVQPGSLFVALSGERTDGHRYLAEAAEGGARAALVRRGADELARVPDSLVLIEVSDPLEALQNAAARHIQRMPALRIGITGSNGKTTTKEILVSVLSQRDATFFTRGNFNSDIGIPMSAFELTSEHRYAVFEMAMNHKGEMARLAQIVRPHIALITNIGTAHIGLIGSRRGIALEKKAIASAFTGGETLFVPEDDDFRSLLEDGVRGTVEAFGPSSAEYYLGYSDRGTEGSVLHFEEGQARLSIPGRHNVRNALGVVAIARSLGLDSASIITGLEAARAADGRMQVISGAVTVLSDEYNANPDSMIAALSTLAEARTEGRRVAVLGEMMELGEYAAKGHEKVLRSLATLGLDAVCLVGSADSWQLEKLGFLHGAAPMSRVADTDEAAEWLRRRLAVGDLVLLKGSRSVGLERLRPLLTDAEVIGGSRVS
jgi:UDP-N-acetylmuramoyl-tripeptide--D-alanyl-D-alanine ligase